MVWFRFFFWLLLFFGTSAHCFAHKHDVALKKATASSRVDCEGNYLPANSVTLVTPSIVEGLLISS